MNRWLHMLKVALLALAIAECATAESFVPEGSSCSERVAIRGAPLEALPLDLSVDRYRDYRTPLLVAHGRGHSPAMESTWENLAGSVRDGADVLEIDVQMTNDGQLIIAHDPFHKVGES